MKSTRVFINDDFVESAETGNTQTNSNRSRYFHDLTISETLDSTRDKSVRTLKTFTGVFCPVALAQFSTMLFLRTGFVLGQTGLILTFVQLFLAYSILFMTILSICAISTNGAIKGGGVYFMISRTLGPEIGGSIGIMFYLGNVFSSALYISGFVEGLVNNFGPSGSLANALPDGVWWRYLYGSMLGLFCLGVCMIGGSMFAKTSLFIFIVVVICLSSVIVTFLFHPAKLVALPHNNIIIYPDPNNITEDVFANYTGLSAATLGSNIIYHVSQYDYTTDKPVNFLSVFAILFAGVTGIMNGANMSGELLNPAKSIPMGTLSATVFTLLCYIVCCLLSAASCDRKLLLNDYLYMQGINYWPPFIIIGIFSTTLSAALGNLIGASRVLQALANDAIFGFLLNYAKRVTKGGNPIVAVIISFVLVQLVLLIGKVNLIAPAVTVFFLLAYAAVNCACALLDMASASNFRPHFKYFTWWTSLVGLLACLIMCFLINFEYAIGLVILFIALIVVLNLRHMEHAWGNIGQALLYHQVRKYLLLLDNRKDHVKYWRPQVLLLLSNARSQARLISFANCVKKGGLYVLGHVICGDFSQMSQDPTNPLHRSFIEVKDYLRVKAFVDVTVARTVRDGCRHLVRLCGLGGMAINTVCLGFRDDEAPRDVLRQIQVERQQRKAAKWRKLLLHSSSNYGTAVSGGGGVDLENPASNNNSGKYVKFTDADADADADDLVNDNSGGGSSNNLRSNESARNAFTNIRMKKLVQPIRDPKFFSELPPIRTAGSAKGDGQNDDDDTDNNPATVMELSESGESSNQITAEEYIGIIQDCIKLQKNVCLCRNFATIPDEDTSVAEALAVVEDRQQDDNPQYIDVWPINFLQPGSGSYLDNSCKLMLQLACILRASSWHSTKLRIRVFICLDYYYNGNCSEDPATTANTEMPPNIEQLWTTLLRQWRIPAQILLVQWDDVVLNLEQHLGHELLLSHVGTSSLAFDMPNTRTISAFNCKLPDEYVIQVNQLLRSRMNNSETSVCFLYLPLITSASSSTETQTYLRQLTLLTEKLPPCVLVRGQQEVMTVAI